MPIIPTIITNNYDGKESKDIFSLLPVFCKLPREILEN